MIARARQRSLVEALRADDGVERLARGIAYAERFHFFLLVCEMPRVADAVLELLREEVPKEREEPVRFVVLDPYRAHADLSKPIPYDLLVNEVLARLAAPAAEERAADVVFVVDASRAVKQDDESWVMMFQRMNERRNVISEALGGPLLLVLPERLEPVFAHAAPDVWSIRSTAVLIRLPDAERGLLAGGIGNELPDLRADAWSEASAEQVSVEEIEKEIAALRARLEANPEDEDAETSLLIWLDRRVDNEVRRGMLDAARRAVEEMVHRARAWVARHSDLPGERFVLARSLNRAGDVASFMRDFEGARAAYDECIAIARPMVEGEPESSEWARALVGALIGIGDLERETEHEQQAMEAFQEAYLITRPFQERYPDRIEWQAAVSETLLQIGFGLLLRGEPTQALEALEWVRENAREKLSKHPTSSGAIKELIVSQLFVGNAYRAMKALTLALGAYEEGLELARRLCELAPEQPTGLELRSAVSFQVALTYLYLGDITRAHRVMSDVVHALRMRLQRDSDSRAVHRMLASALLQQSAIFDAIGDRATALASLAEADAIFEALRKAGTMSKEMQHEAELCHSELARLEATPAS